MWANDRCSAALRWQFVKKGSLRNELISTNPFILVAQVLILWSEEKLMRFYFLLNLLELLFGHLIEF